MPKDQMHSVAEITSDDRLMLLREMTVLAGLLHDVGKSNAFFQAKLDSAARVSDPVRHEIISLFVINAIFDRIKKAGASNPDFAALHLLRDAADDPALLRAILSDAFDAANTILAAPNPAAHRMPVPGADMPIMHALSWIVLTHHKLPRGERGAGGRLRVTLGTHVDDRCRDPLLPAPGLAGLDDEEGWRMEVSASASRILAATPGASSVSGLILATYGRSGLMLGDHGASSQQPAAIETLTATGARRQRAKSDTPGKDGLPALPGEPLADHLVRVAENAGRAHDTLIAGPAGFPSISRSDLPAGVLDVPSAASRFAWQTDAVGKITALHDAGIRESGFLGFVLAGTGTGKTRTCPKLLAALSPRLRYTVCLGLRSLTLQTGAEYRTEVGFRSDHLAVQIGSEAVRLLHELAQQERETVGVDAEDPEDDGAVVALDGAGDVPPDQDIPETAALEAGGKIRRLRYFRAPVLVTTVDSVMPAADARRGRHLAAALRLASADLVLDEVDAYDEEDIVALCRLVTLAGAYGRRVIVSSATLPPAVAEALYRCYAAGWSAHAALFGKPPSLFCGWFSDVSAATAVQDIADVEAFRTQHAAATATVIQALSCRPPRRVAGVLEISPEMTEEEVFDAVLGGCRRLHEQHHVVDPSTGKRISIGIVRWANIGPCRSFTRHAARADMLGIEIRLLCYHGRLPGIIRYDVERFLDAACSRKPPGDGLLEHPLVRKLLNEVTADDVMVIVSATPVEEIGRDHDFDHAVADVSSARSLTQLAGRVGRHRELRPGTPNMLLFAYPFRHLRNVWNGRPEGPSFIWPGAETKDVRGAGSYRLPTAHVPEVVDLDGWGRRIDAGPALSVPERGSFALAELEHRKLSDMLLGTDAANAFLSAADFSKGRVEILLSDYHPRERLFRRPDGIEVAFWYCPAGTEAAPGWHAVVRDGRGVIDRQRNSAVVSGRLTTDERRRFLISFDRDGGLQRFDDVAERIFNMPEDCQYAAENLLSFKKVVYGVGGPSEAMNRAVTEFDWTLGAE